MPAPPTRVLLVRHGQSTWNAEGRWQGHADPPLSPLGLAQARAAVAAVGTVDGLVSSDLVRARQTAQILAEGLGIGPVVTEPRLRERDAGEWTGLRREEIEARFPGYLASGRRPPGFELDDQIIGRVRAALADLHERWSGGTVLAVAHGGVIRTLTRVTGGHEGVVPNLGGRWFDVHDSWIALGHEVLLVDPARVATTRPDQL